MLKHLTLNTTHVERKKYAREIKHKCNFETFMAIHARRLVGADKNTCKT
jgi:hypothetical protein